ncbi:type I-F CRISPR-associated endoribonuclease Cas6/Csy4 [Isoalcanivorax beigongshangi]|uniref:Type I-F CRISPR-associated endoribonuclease Cas6/Csy4 n=1 Tax=Isoalcanivorax beigongshangi TaxID=3238810 RepID=A0ABV4AHQ2_9GAMM
MTTHYLDLKVMPDPETSGTQLLGALYGRLHQLLVQQRWDDVGVSFPRHSLQPRSLGQVLRLHGSEARLRQMAAMDWLKALRDHVQATDIAAVPDGCKHRTVRRQQFKTNAERLRRRRMRRKGETAEAAAEAIPYSIERRPTLPYVHLRSQSTGQSFCLFIHHGALQDQPTSGVFNSYGLGGEGSVPWF